MENLAPVHGSLGPQTKSFKIKLIFGAQDQGLPERRLLFWMHRYQRPRGSLWIRVEFCKGALGLPESAVSRGWSSAASQLHLLPRLGNRRESFPSWRGVIRRKVRKFRAVARATCGRERQRKEVSP